MDPCEITPCKMHPCEMDPCKIALCKMDPCKIAPCEMDPWEMDPWEMDPYKMDPCEMDRFEIAPSKMPICQNTHLPKCFFAKIHIYQKAFLPKCFFARNRLLKCTCKNALARCPCAVLMQSKKQFYKISNFCSGEYHFLFQYIGWIYTRFPPITE